jgi:mRNA interferase RelE/StbE
VYGLKFHPEARRDIEKLDGSRQKLFAKKLRQILENPQIGKELGNKAGMELNGYKKANEREK